MKKIILLFMIILFTACQKNTKTSSEEVHIDNKSINIDNVSDNISKDNKSVIQDNLSQNNKDNYNTIVNVMVDKNGETITEVYIENTNKEQKVNKKYNDLLVEYKDTVCNDIITSSLQKYKINEKMKDNIISLKGYTIAAPSVLHIAVICEYSSLIKELINQGADINLESNDYITPMDLAKEINNKEIIEIMTNAEKSTVK